MSRKRNAQGSGSIRQRANGRWEGRYTAGRNAKTGKQIQKSVYGDTELEVVKKLQKALVEIEQGSFLQPQKLTVSNWLDIWLDEYIGNVKPATRASYNGLANNHIKEELGGTPLQKLTAHQIQSFYNSRQKKGLSAKTIRNIHGVLNATLNQAELIGYIKQNPARAVTLPRVEKKEISVLSGDSLTDFLNEIAGKEYESLFFVTLFTGMRQGEILGLPWECVNFDTGIITIKQQLSKEKKEGGKYYIAPLKNDKTRKIKPAPQVMECLKQRRAEQAQHQLRVGRAWANKDNLVFTNELGGHFTHTTVWRHFKKIAIKINQPALRFHDLRHSFAVISIANGDDIKTVQDNLGHHTASFTLDTYGHVTEQMQSDSSNRMDNFIKNLG